jgi:hypothetical protein
MNIKRLSKSQKEILSTLAKGKPINPQASWEQKRSLLRLEARGIVIKEAGKVRLKKLSEK